MLRRLFYKCLISSAPSYFLGVLRNMVAKTVCPSMQYERFFRIVDRSAH